MEELAEQERKNFREIFCIECSPKTGENVNVIFDTIFDKLHNQNLQRFPADGI
jgi:GTPase SAR1 family protein